MRLTWNIVVNWCKTSGNDISEKRRTALEKVNMC